MTGGCECADDTEIVGISSERIEKYAMYLLRKRNQ